MILSSFVTVCRCARGQCLAMFCHAFAKWEALAHAVVCAIAGNIDDRRLQGFFMDTNCQYSSHLRNLAGEDILDSLECYLGWLHSKAGHDMGCQLKFSGLYAEGFGRAIGENAEQLHVSLA